MMHRHASRTSSWSARSTLSGGVRTTPGILAATLAARTAGISEALSFRGNGL